MQRARWSKNRIDKNVTLKNVGHNISQRFVRLVYLLASLVIVSPTTSWEATFTNNEGGIVR